MGLELATIGTLFSIGSGVMGVVNGFVQAGQAQAVASAQEKAAAQNLALQRNAAVHLQEEQAISATAQQSTRMAQAERNLGTLAAVMGERGLSKATFTGMANDISNNESLDLSRIGINYENQASADTMRIAAANQDYVNTVADAESRKSASTTASWLNALGTTLKVGGSIYSERRRLEALRKSKSPDFSDLSDY